MSTRQPLSHRIRNLRYKIAALISPQMADMAGRAEALQALADEHQRAQTIAVRRCNVFDMAVNRIANDPRTPAPASAVAVMTWIAAASAAELPDWEKNRMKSLDQLMEDIADMDAKTRPATPNDRCDDCGRPLTMQNGRAVCNACNKVPRRHG